MNEDKEELKHLLTDLLTQKMAAKGIQDSMAHLQGRFLKAGLVQTEDFFERINRDMGLVQDNMLLLYKGLNGISDEKENEL